MRQTERNLLICADCRRGITEHEVAFIEEGIVEVACPEIFR